MKKTNLVVGAIASLALTLGFWGLVPQDAVAGESKVSICHISPGNPDKPQTITVPVRAVAAHLAHGDVQAPCDDLCASANECDDGNACTTDSCDGRLCVNTPIDPSACDDEDVCTADSCSPDVGCVNSPLVCDAQEICVSPDLGCTDANEPVGTITADILRGGNFGTEWGVESQASNLVADTNAWAAGAQIAFMNPSGVRSDLIYVQSAGEGDGVVTMAEAFAFQPFGNILETFPMTGAQIISVLEEQCRSGSARPFAHLGVSEGFTYDLAKTIIGSDCTSVTVSNVKLDGVALSPTATYTVTVNSFLSGGGDGFSTFDTIPESSKVEGGTDLDAVINYLGTFSPVAPPSTDRVNETDEPVGTITADITRGGGFGTQWGVESQASNLVADTNAWAAGAQIAFMNPSGVRSDLIYAQSAGEGDGVVTWAEAFAFQPFGNILETFPMTGAQIISALLEQCRLGSARPFAHLGVSEGFTYDLATTIIGSDCTSVTVSNVKLDGVALSPTTTYTVTVNSFLSSGGDGFSTFDTIPESSKSEGGTDLDAVINYLGTFSPVAPPSTDRVNELP